MFLPSLFAMSIFMAMDLESFNRFFDVFVWIYLVAAIAVVVSFRKRQATSDSAATPEPVVYSLKKKVNTENLSWKQKFIGTWAKIERKNFYEVRRCPSPRHIGALSNAALVTVLCSVRY
jgi:hypothetical protein